MNIDINISYVPIERREKCCNRRNVLVLTEYSNSIITSLSDQLWEGD